MSEFLTTHTCSLLQLRLASLHLIYDWAFWFIPEGFDVSAELSLDAHQVYSLSGGPWNVLTVEMITATLSLDTHPSDLLLSGHD